MSPTWPEPAGGRTTSSAVGGREVDLLGDHLATHLAILNRYVITRLDFRPRRNFRAPVELRVLVQDEGHFCPFLELRGQISIDFDHQPASRAALHAARHLHRIPQS